MGQGPARCADLAGSRLEWSIMSWFSSLKGRLSRSRRASSQASTSVAIPRLNREPPSSGLPRFKTTANEADGNRISADSPAEVRLNGAFTPAQPIADLRRFSGRADLVEHLIRVIEDRRMHVVLHGERGIGKTSLLHILAILARDARYLVRYTSCSESSEFDDLFRQMMADIQLLYHREYDPTSPEAEKGLTLGDTFGDRPLTPTNLSEVCAKLAGTRVLLILDEFDRASSAAFRNSVAELIKNLSDRSARVQIVIGGVAGNLAELIEHIPSIRRNVLGVPVGPMSDADLAQIISNAEDLGGIRFDEDARQALLHAANGSPYLVNLIGHQAGHLALDANSSAISIRNVREATAHVADELRSRLGEQAVKQLAALEEVLPEEALLRMARQSQHNFGKLSAGQSQALEPLRAAGHAEWWDEEGTFSFCDESIPVIVWLSRAGS